MPKVLVVGGGILGTAHALEAVRRGFDVTQFEAEPEPRASTARSPGALHFSWAAGALDLELSLRSAAESGPSSRRHRPPGFFRRTGSHVVASPRTELEVLRFPSGPARCRDAVAGELLGPRSGARSNPAVDRPDFLASLYSDLDAVVEPRRRARPTPVATSLGATSYRFLGGREVRDFGSDSVTDATGRVHRGDLVVLCPGIRSDLASSALRQPTMLRRSGSRWHRPNRWRPADRPGSATSLAPLGPA